MRLAWFSPMPPARSGVAACSRDLVSALRDQHTIDVFVDDPLVSGSADGRSAHEFLWRHRLDPYDLTVYQVGNSSNHDYLWPYLFRFPGLAVLHDVRLHHARAAALLRRGRVDHYRAEFAANHPELDPSLAEMAVAGFDTPLYYHWPMTRLIARTSRLIAVHTRAAAAALRAEDPEAAIREVALGHGQALDDAARRAARGRARARWSIPADTLVFGCFGGLTVEKRVPQILKAFAATLAYAPKSRLLLAGDSPDPRALRADIHRLGLDAHVTITGYLDSDAGADRVHRGVRRVAEPPLADGRRDVRSVAALPGARPADGDRRSRAPGGRAVARSADLAASRRRRRGRTGLHRRRHPRRGSLAGARDAPARHASGPPGRARARGGRPLAPDACARGHDRGLPPPARRGAWPGRSRRSPCRLTWWTTAAACSRRSGRSSGCSPFRGDA